MTGAYCPVVWDPKPESLLRDRAIYILWRAALVCLVWLTAGKLESVELRMPEAPEAPWEDAYEHEPIVISVAGDAASEQPRRSARETLPQATPLAWSSRRNGPVRLVKPEEIAAEAA